MAVEFTIKVDPASGHQYLASPVKGRRILTNPRLNKGTAFKKRERSELGLEGLLPPQISTMKQQLERTYAAYRAKETNLERFIYLTGLQDRNETLFYRLVLEHIDEMMPIVYTPVVGEACQRFSHIYRRPRGLYISIEQQDRIEEILENSEIEKPSIIVVTDGERILGLGDQGAGGMGIPIGKLCLYTLCAGVSPYATLPITLDVGTDNQERLDDPLYLGLGHKRIRGEKYQEFIDKFVAAVKKVFPSVCLQWEDFLKGNALKQLARFRDELCCFNDDIQGTAGVVLAGLYSALKITGKPMKDQKILFAGAGASAQGISNLLVSAMMEEGLTREQAIRRIWTVDSRGLVAQDRDGLEDFKATYARPVDELADYECKDRSKVTLEEAVKNAEPTILIGTSGTPGTFTQSIVETMAANNERPIIFPISNPTSKTEVKPEDAIKWSKGTVIMATGSPFGPVEYEGKTYRIGQGNNAFVFPGIGLGVAFCEATRVSDGMFLEGAKALASKVTDEDLEGCAVFPQLTRIRECSEAVACATVRRAVEEGLADPDYLDDLEDSIHRSMWEPEYVQVRYDTCPC